MTSSRRVTSPGTARGTRSRRRIGASRAAMWSMHVASRPKSNSCATCVRSSATALDRSKRSSVRCSAYASAAKSAKSSAMSASAPSCCTLTATSRGRGDAPTDEAGRSVARCTCATDAEPSGTSAKALNTSSKARPSDASSSATTRRATCGGIGGTSSSSGASAAHTAGGHRSPRVLKNCAALTWKPLASAARQRTSQRIQRDATQRSSLFAHRTAASPRARASPCPRARAAAPTRARSPSRRRRPAGRAR